MSGQAEAAPLGRRWRRALPILLVLAGCAAIGVFILLAATYDYVTDDAFITFRYADHWVETGSLTWHVDLPRVDGFTSLGHVLLLALGRLAGFDLIDVGTAINLFCAVGIFLVYGETCRELGLGGWPRVAGLFVIAINASLAHWLTGGLDALLWTLCFALAYLAVERDLARTRLSGALIASLLALVLVRPEGSLIAPALLGYVLAILWMRGRIDGSSAVLATSIVATAILTLHLWRLASYGHWLPNTFYAKSAASRWTELQDGVRYIWLWGWAYGGILGLLFLLRLPHSDRAPSTIGLFALGLLALVALEGGDPHPVMRFLLPLLPLLAIRVASTLSWGGFNERAAAYGLVFIYAVSQFGGEDQKRGVFPFHDSAFSGRLIQVEGPWGPLLDGARRLRSGKWPIWNSNYEHWQKSAVAHLGELLKDDVRVAATDVGALAYYSRQPILDASGLNSIDVRQNVQLEGEPNHWGSWTGHHFHDPLAKVAIFGFPNFIPTKLTHEIVAALPQEQIDQLAIAGLAADFSERYTCVSSPHPSGGPLYLNFWVRREWAEDVWAERPEGLEIADCW